jgi:3-phenylpropionate/trans-cinnamate dioxygenase ferredoxin subunit
MALERAEASGGFVTVARASQIEPGTVRVVEVDGRSLCVGLTEDGEWGAIDNVCTHDGGVLGEGELDDEAAYATRVEGDEVQVEL